MHQTTAMNLQNNFETVKSDMDNQKSAFLTRLTTIEDKLKSLTDAFDGIVDTKDIGNTITKLKVDQKINKRIVQSNKKFERELIYLKLGMEKLFTKLNTDIDTQISDLKLSVNMSESSIRSNINEFNMLTIREFNIMKDNFKEFQKKNEESEGKESNY